MQDDKVAPSILDPPRAATADFGGLSGRTFYFGDVVIFSQSAKVLNQFMKIFTSYDCYTCVLTGTGT